MKFTQIAFVAYPVTDMARSRQFYEKSLGLKPTLVMDEDAEFLWTEYDIGSGTLGIGQSDMMPEPTAEGASIALEPDDFPKTAEELKKNGVKFVMEPKEMEPGHFMAIIADPDGSQIMIHKKTK